MTNELRELMREIVDEMGKSSSHKEILKRARSNYMTWSKGNGGRLTKAILFALQKGRCKLCNTPLTLSFHGNHNGKSGTAGKASTLDHVVPLRETLKHSAYADYQILCMKCNNKKD